MHPHERDLIDRAARASGRESSEFVLEAARLAAEAAWLDRSLIVATQDGFDQLQTRLCAEPAPNPRLCQTAQGKVLPLSTPELLGERADVSSFDCGVAWLNDWLKRRLSINAAVETPWAFVLPDGGKVGGYYTLNPGRIEVLTKPGDSRKPPKPVAILTLGRLAIDSSQQGRGLSRVLLRDVMSRAIRAEKSGAIGAVLVPLIAEREKDFYLGLGFEPSPFDPMIMMVTIGDMKSASAAPA